MSDFSILQFLFSHKDSLEKWRWQGSWTTIARRRFLHSRRRILLKYRADRGPARPLPGYMFYVLTQGFSGKVAFTGILEEHCSETLSAFPRQDPLEMSRWQRSSAIHFSAFSQKASFEKSRQGSRTTIALIHVLRSHTRILWKFHDHGGPGRTLLGDAFCIPAEGFS